MGYPRTIRRRCHVCGRRFPLGQVVVLRLVWASDLVEDEILCVACVDEVPIEVLESVPHEWVGAVA